MSDSETKADIARVQKRIQRLRRRLDGRVRDMIPWPVSAVASLTGTTGKRSSHWVLSLVAAAVGAYFTRPGAWQQLCSAFKPLWSHATNEQASTDESTVSPDDEAENSTE